VSSQARITKRWKGLHAARLKDVARNPLEVRFARAWHRLNTEAGHDTASHPSVLDEMLHVGDPHFPPEVSDRDRAVASTVIQWLGTDVDSRWALKILESESIAKIKRLSDRLDRLGPDSAFSSAEIEFMETAAGMELDPKDERMMRRILRKMRANG
jgi:hypothetical protein